MSSADGSRRVALAGALLALASVLGLLESAMLPPIPIPGVRLGLANLAVLVAVSALGPKWGLGVSLGRVGVVGVATGTLFGPVGALSLAGALAAWCAIVLLRRYGPRFSLVGWSIGGAAAHVSAQLGVAGWLVGSAAVLLWAPLSLALGSICGLAVGLLSHSLVSRTYAPGVGVLRGRARVGADGAAAGQ